MSGCLKQARLPESNQVAVSSLRLAAGRNQYTLPVSDILEAFDFLRSTSVIHARDYRNDLIAARVQNIDLEYHLAWRGITENESDGSHKLVLEADDRRVECYFTLRTKLGLSAYEYDMAQALEDLLEYERVSDVSRITSKTTKTDRVA